MNKPRRHAKKINPPPPTKVDSPLLAAEMREASRRTNKQFSAILARIEAIEEDLDSEPDNAVVPQTDRQLSTDAAARLKKTWEEFQTGFSSSGQPFIPVDAEGRRQWGTSAVATPPDLAVAILQMELGKLRDENQRLHAQLTQARRALTNGDLRWLRRRGVK
jgi:hypothetical protein